ncbi:MAG: type IV-A pilus assembly ATPase PilB [Pseudomonadales bacterium]|nr:type IV-A pilus assembly ATPase PilB [Pseudomonadales bacterium]NRA16353.1 type IV-A pilus assembly ATPase PilB [Oceanospirillaceae bacterium]
MQTTKPLVGLARRLVKDGYFSAQVAHLAIEKARSLQKPFISHIIAEELISNYNAAFAASDEFGLPLFDLDIYAPDNIPEGLVDEKLILKHRALPIMKRNKKIFVAVADPTNTNALDDFKFHTGLNTEAVIVEEDKLQLAIDNFLDKQGSGLDDLEDNSLDNLELEDTEPEQIDDSSEDPTKEAPIVRFVNKVLLDCIRKGASDIHFEPYEKTYRVRSRIDGILQEVARPPSALATRLSARLKVMSKMDISERRVPQDGRIKMRLSKTRSIDFRVNSLPTLWGEKIVLRILDSSSAKIGVDALGFDAMQKKLFLETLVKPQGMILVTGPTGSGKTVSLYTGLNILNTEERNISTAEDPVEINLEGINQVHVNPKVGLTFAEALRSFLRQDPDVVMVGEIRDLETAEISIKAAQTGHMVLSTLHTNSAAETLTRLRNMGVEAFNVATAVSLIIAQRLARRLCEECKVSYTIPENALLEAGFDAKELHSLSLYEPNSVGCNKCTKGYKGRVGIYEALAMSPEISDCIMNNGTSMDILDIALRQGFRPLKKSGLDKVAQGITSLEELNRVITI